MTAVLLPPAASTARPVSLSPLVTNTLLPPSPWKVTPVAPLPETSRVSSPHAGAADDGRVVAARGIDGKAGVVVAAGDEHVVAAVAVEGDARGAVARDEQGVVAPRRGRR